MAGYCDFGIWANRGNLNMNGPNGWAELYLMTEEETNIYSKENNFDDSITAQEQKENWERLLTTYALLSDDDLKLYFNANDRGIEKFRDYIQDHLSTAINEEKERSADSFPYTDSQGNYDIGDSWDPGFKASTEKTISLYHMNPEEIISYVEKDQSYLVYDENGELVTDPETIKYTCGLSIIDLIATSDEIFKEVYGATDEDINRLRTYYVHEFCK